MDKLFERIELKSHHHDKIFHLCFSGSRRYISLARLALGEEVFREFDWRTARKEETRQVDAKLRETRQDLRVSVRMKHAKGDAYRVPLHFEHKSHKDSDLMRQLYHYQTAHNDFNRTPLVSIVVYHGTDSDWRTVPNYQQWLPWGDDECKQRLINVMGGKLLDFGGYMLNLRELMQSGRQLDGNIDAVVYLLTEIWDLDEKKLKIFFKKATRLSGPDRDEIIMALRVYVKTNYPNITMTTLDRIKKEAVGDKIYSLKHAWAKEWADEWAKKRDEVRNEVRDEVRYETEERFILHMVEQGADSDYICRMTGLPRETVDKYRLNGKG